ncbi:MAG: hypothetical protein ABR497_08835 [Kiritimatiellia bacterium]
MFSVQPDTFEYLFTTVSSTADPFILSFNDRQNRTQFVAVGDYLGEYLVKSFTPVVNKVFQPALGDYLETAGSVELQGRTGEIWVLEQGIPLPASGWCAWLVDLDTAEIREAREQDTVSIGGMKLHIRHVTPEKVDVVAAGSAFNLTFISPEETTAVTAGIRRRREQEEQDRIMAALQHEQAAAASRLQKLEQREKELQDREQRLNAQAQRQFYTTQMLSSKPRSLFVGYDYPCPTVYRQAADGSGRVVYWTPMFPYVYPRRPWPLRHHRQGTSGGYAVQSDTFNGNYRIQLRSAW